MNSDGRLGAANGPADAGGRLGKPIDKRHEGEYADREPDGDEERQVKKE